MSTGLARPPAGVPEPGSRAAALARDIVAAGGGGVRLLLLFGSRLVHASPTHESAWDFLAVVDDQQAFYEAWTRAGLHSRSPRFLAGVGKVLAPNVLAYVPEGPDPQIAKLMVLDRAAFERALSPDARDHFVRGRLVQAVHAVYARSSADRAWLERLLAGARRDVLRWAGPWLDDTFTPAGLARRMLRVSYAGELRPERTDRVDEVFEAQRETLEGTFLEMLRDAEREGLVRRVDEERWALAERPDVWEALRWRLWFARSKVRATLRWFKHALTFDDWMTYLERKVERRTGHRIELTPLERRYPALFLWPTIVRVLRRRDAGGDERRRGGGGEGTDGGPGDDAGTGAGAGSAA